MSMMRQIGLLLLGTLLLALAASVTVNVLSTRSSLQTQLELKNSDNATALAQVLSQHKGQAELMELTLAAQFDTGYYRRIRFVGIDGKVSERMAGARPSQAPSWFVALVPIDSRPGMAQVSDGWRALGSVEVQSQSTYAYDALWSASLWSLGTMLLIGVLAGLVAWASVQRIHRPLDAAVRQAVSLQRGEYLTVAEPRTPELRRLTQAMNAMVARLRSVFEAQTAQVETLRRQGSRDALTGLSNRTHFLARLGAALQREDGVAAGGLVLLRVSDLVAINRAFGRTRADQLIIELASALRTGSQRVGGAFPGRLNGSDFALWVPVAGSAGAVARDLVERMRTVLASFSSASAVAAGTVEIRRNDLLGELMSRADLALARAESAGPFAVESTGDNEGPWVALGAQRWRQGLQDALAQGRVQLGSYPLVDIRQALVYRECPLRIQLEPDGAFEVAAHWLPLAVRSGLTCAADEQALQLALAAVERDGQARCVNFSPASLLDSGFAARMRALLLARAHAAGKVWIEVSEDAAMDRFELVRELARQLRPTGVHFGLEHAGERLGRIERLFDAGLDYVKLDHAVTHGVGTDAGRKNFVKGLVTMLHSIAVQVHAEDVQDASDAQVLWECGVDGMTGPWISAQTNC